jgi:hypothetical protein
MENEVSSISKLGIVLIALAVLIGLGFGIFQISKGTANTGVNNVQEQLDSVSQSAYTTYDQTVITGTMVRSAISDFEGKSCAILVATQAWVNALADLGIGDPLGRTPGTATASAVAPDNLLNVSYAADSESEVVSTTAGGIKTDDYKSFVGIEDAYAKEVNELPVVWAYSDSEFKGGYIMSNSKGGIITGAFINYNTLVGNGTGSGTESTAPEGCTGQTAKINTQEVYMAGVYFDTNKYVCTSGYATDSSGKTLSNNVTTNLSKTGKTEFIPTGAKFQSYLIKDASGTTMGFAVTQVGN